MSATARRIGRLSDTSIAWPAVQLCRLAWGAKLRVATTKYVGGEAGFTEVKQLLVRGEGGVVRGWGESRPPGAGHPVLREVRHSGCCRGGGRCGNDRESSHEPSRPHQVCSCTRALWSMPACPGAPSFEEVGRLGRTSQQWHTVSAYRYFRNERFR